MAKLTFSEEELKKLLFCELVREEDGPNGPGFTRFYGFFRSEALMRARGTRSLYGIFQHYNKVLGDRMRMSDYLTFLASLFREIENQENPEKRENPCAEVALPTMDRTNTNTYAICGKDLSAGKGTKHCLRYDGHPGECSSA